MGGTTGAPLHEDSTSRISARRWFAQQSARSGVSGRILGRPHTFSITPDRPIVIAAHCLRVTLCWRRYAACQPQKAFAAAHSPGCRGYLIDRAAAMLEDNN
jgi:hypothetical protein